MSENCIVINGKRAELTEEQLEKLGIQSEKNQYEKMFERRYNENYYVINSQGNSVKFCEFREIGDDQYFNVGNYCHNEAVMKQRALHETLNRLLWRASVIAGELDNPWNDHSPHYVIMNTNGDFFVHIHDEYKYFEPHFPTRNAAVDAIENIVKPFMKEHPNFVW